MSYKVETVLKDAASTIGESPHWDDATQTLLYVDILKGDVHRYDPVTGKVDDIHLGEAVQLIDTSHVFSRSRENNIYTLT